MAEEVEVLLNRNELAILYRMVDDRVLEAEAEGIEAQASQVLRQKLMDAIIRYRQTYGHG